MSGISDIGNTAPNYPSSSSAETSGTELPAQDQTTEQSSETQSVDSIIREDSSTPSFLLLGTSGTVPLSSEYISEIDVLKAISAATHDLRKRLQESEHSRQDIQNEFYMATIKDAESLISLFFIARDVAKPWNNYLEVLKGQITAAYKKLVEDQNNFNSLVKQTTANDKTHINDVNKYIEIHNNPSKLLHYANTHFGGDLGAAINEINNHIDAYNSYMDGRPNLQAALDTYVNSAKDYNALIDTENTNIDTVNAEMGEKSPALLEDPYSPLPHMEKAVLPSSNIKHYVPYEGQMPNTLPKMPPPLPIPPVTVTPSYKNLEGPPTFNFPHVPDANVLGALWFPIAIPMLAFFTSFDRVLRLAEAQIEEETLSSKQAGKSIILPDGFLQRARTVFTDSSGFGSTGLAAFAMGLHSKNLEIALSRAVSRGVAAVHSMPISGRQFATLKFTALELLQKSALLSPIPALRFIASALGTIGASNPAINVAISLAIIQQVTGLINGGVVRSFVNGMFNKMPFYARIQQRVSLKGEALAESALKAAVLSGNPERIKEAIQLLGNARIELSQSNRLLNAFGLQSIGGMASFSNALSASVNLSILSFALAKLGRSIGLPGVVSQFFAQSGLPAADTLAAMHSGSRILDLLDNPLSIIALKENLANTLSLKGLAGKGVDKMIDSAINSIILKGGINTFSQLRADLSSAFSKAGFSSFQTNLLANETMALISGDLGVGFLNVAFGLNFDNSAIATAVVDNMLKTGSGFAEAMLANAFSRSLLLNGESANSGQLPSFALNAIESAIGNAGTTFQTQREFRDAVFNELKGAGFNAKDAMYLANSAAAYGLTGSLTPLFGISSSELAAIGKSVVNRVANDLGISSSQAEKIFNEAKENAFKAGPFSSADQFQIALKEQISREIAAQTGNGGGNVLFELAIADLSDPGQILGLGALAEQISSSATAVLNSAVGSRLAKEIKDEILRNLMGGTQIDEIETQEKKNPLSVLNQMKSQLQEILKTEDQGALRKTIRELTELLKTFETPNAEMGFTIQSLSDSPSTFIGSVLGSQQPIGEFLQIPV